MIESKENKMKKMKLFFVAEIFALGVAIMYMRKKGETKL